MCKQRKPICINLYGGPGCGKSTCASFVFATLKSKGIKAELITEFAKDCVWEGNLTAIRNQCYVFGNQYYRMCRVSGVDVIITDSPLLLTSVYDSSSQGVKSALKNLAYEAYLEFNNRDYFIVRDEDFEVEGRVHSKIDSIQKDSEIKTVLGQYGIAFKTIGRNECAKTIEKDVFEELSERIK